MHEKHAIEGKQIDIINLIYKKKPYLFILLFPQLIILFIFDHINSLIYAPLMSDFYIPNY